jgi:hypothetical protein
MLLKHIEINFGITKNEDLHEDLRYVQDTPISLITRDIINNTVGSIPTLHEIQPSTIWFEKDLSTVCVDSLYSSSVSRGGQE